MQEASTILSILKLKENGFSYNDIRFRYKVGNSTITDLLNKAVRLGITYQDLTKMDNEEVIHLFYPNKQKRKKDVPLPDFEQIYRSLTNSKTSTNLYFIWLEYKKNQDDGYQYTQFKEHYKRWLTKNHLISKLSMSVVRIPGEIMYIDWIGDTLPLVMNHDTGEVLDAHFFVTTLGVSSYAFAEAFPNEKTDCFIQGNIQAIEFYGCLPKIFKSDNCKTAVVKNTKDELIVNKIYQDLESFYDVVIVPAPPRKPKGKPSVENHVRWFETHLLGKLKGNIYDSFSDLNEDVLKIINELNLRPFQKDEGNRKELFEKYDKVNMRPLPKDKFTLCEYKIQKIPNNYHAKYDNHYYSVPFTYFNQEVIVKATAFEIKICDSNNHLICIHAREYKKFPKYITKTEHMPAQHKYYKEMQEHNGAYYQRWASVYGSDMRMLIDRILKSFRHEEQAYNTCNGILHLCDNMSKEQVNEAANICIQSNTCQYTYFKKNLNEVCSKSESKSKDELPEHQNIRGKDYYK